mgnify:CR=1 FL=1
MTECPQCQKFKPEVGEHYGIAPEHLCTCCPTCATLKAQVAAMRKVVEAARHLEFGNHYRQDQVEMAHKLLRDYVVACREA